jgi:ribosomal-protein-alanine N-acetyltransferase
MPPFDLTGSRIGIRRPVAEDYDQFLAMVQSSRQLHRPWVEPPCTREAYASYVGSRSGPMDDGFLVCDLGSDAIAGVVNLNCVVRGHFQSAHLGYYASAGFAQKGYMTEGLRIVTRYAFEQMSLHRVEANIQPENVASIALVRRCGFRKEGFSPKYLKVAGQWRDHERWALLADELTC